MLLLTVLHNFTGVVDVPSNVPAERIIQEKLPDIDDGSGEVKSTLGSLGVAHETNLFGPSGGHDHERNKNGQQPEHQEEKEDAPTSAP